MIQRLRDAGIAVDYALSPAKVGKQFQAAASRGARFAVVVGPDEWTSGEVMLKDLATGHQERVQIAELPERLK
jgi:histidyl-tRNA synthetase